MGFLIYFKIACEERVRTIIEIDKKLHKKQILDLSKNPEVLLNIH